AEDHSVEPLRLGHVLPPCAGRDLAQPRLGWPPQARTSVEGRLSLSCSDLRVLALIRRPVRLLQPGQGLGAPCIEGLGRGRVGAATSVPQLPQQSAGRGKSTKARSRGCGLSQRCADLKRAEPWAEKPPRPMVGWRDAQL